MTLHGSQLFPQGLACPEKRRLSGCNLDDLAGPGIASLSGSAAARVKTPETPQLHLPSISQDLGNAREQDAYDGFGLPVGQMDPGCYSCNEFCLRHVCARVRVKEHVRDGKAARRPSRRGPDTVGIGAAFTICLRIGCTTLPKAALIAELPAGKSRSRTVRVALRKPSEGVFWVASLFGSRVRG